MRSLEQLERRLVLPARAVACFGLFLLGFIAVSTLASGLGRWLLTAPIIGIEDLNRMLAAIAICALLPGVLVEKQNITIRLLGTISNPRIRLVLDAFGELATFAFVTVAAWKVSAFAWRQLAENNLTEIIGLPTAPWWLIAASLLILCVPLQGLILVNQIKRPRNGGP